MPRIGFSNGFFRRYADGAVVRLMTTVREALTKASAECVDIDLPASFEEVIPRHRTVMAVEAAAYHQERLSRHPDDYGPYITELLREGMACPGPDYARARAHQTHLTRAMGTTLEGIDALLCPATTAAAPDAATTGDPAFNSPWSYTGLPVVSLPVMLGDGGLPLSVQLVAGRGAEARLFAVAEWCERVIGGQVGSPPE